MREVLKKIVFNLLNKYKVFTVKKAYEVNYLTISKNGEFINCDLSKEEKELYFKKWSVIDNNVNYETVRICKSLSGKFDVNIVPDYLYDCFFEPNLNRRRETVFLEIKNTYNKWFEGNVFPKIYFHKVNNQYFDEKYTVISCFENYIDSCDFRFPIVCKPSTDTYGGQGVRFIGNKEELMNYLASYDNLVIQEKIIQSKLINDINSGSINTVRVCLYRSVKDQSIKVLNCSLRMGINGGLDNETSGGIVCNINDLGLFNFYAINKKGEKFTKHPNSSFVFANNELPFYKELLDKSIEVASQVIFTNVISLDMCLDDLNEWRCIEINLFGQTIRFAQYAGKAFFGEYTDEVINYCMNNKKVQRLSLS